MHEIYLNLEFSDPQTVSTVKATTWTPATTYTVIH